METFIVRLTGAWFFCVGTAMGSFYNVLVDRLPNDQNVITARSECAFCHTKLKWFDLIPILSFIMLKGRCRYCKEKLSWQYLFSELAVGGLFLFVFLLQGRLFNYAWTVTMLALWSMLYVTGFMDFKYGIIMDRVLIPFAVIGIASQLLDGVSAIRIVQGGLVGFGFYGLIYLIAKLIYKKEGFGGGDVFLLAAIGCFLGPSLTIVTGFLAFYCCLVFILILWLCKKMRRHMEIPFAPSICFSAFIVSLYGNQILYFLGSRFHF